MRNLKKLFAVVLVIAVMLTAMVPAFAEGTTTDISADAKACATLGMLLGGNDGVTSAYTQSEPARIQAAIMLIRLKGVEADAKKATGDNFSDVTAGWMKPYTAYLKANPDLGFVGSNNKFDPNSKIDAKQYYSVLLTVLGYKADYTWDTVLTKAAEVGLKKLDGVSKIKVDDLAAATVEALKTKIKGSDKTLAADLVAKGVITNDKAVAAGVISAVPTSLTATITALNWAEIQVDFSSEVNKDSIDLANVKIDGSALNGSDDVATLSADKKSVVIYRKAGFATQQQQVHKISIKGVKTAVGAVELKEIENQDVKFTDLAIPSIVSVTATGNQKIDVLFSEAIDPNTNSNTKVYSNYRIDGKVLVGDSTKTISIKNRTVSIDLAAALTAGEHTFSFVANTVKDYATFAAVGVDTKFTVADDKVVPTATIKSATQNTVMIQFNKEIKSGDIYWMDGLVKRTATWSKEDDKSLVKATFTNANALPVYSTTLYLENVKDYSGNVMAKTSLAVTATIDTARPSVLSVAPLKGSEESVLLVKFDKDVLLSSVQAYGAVVVKNKDGNIVNGIVKTFNQDSAGKDITKEVKLTGNFGSGSAPYTVTIDKVMDTTKLANQSIPQTFTVTTIDVTAPALATPNGVTVGNTANTVVIVFNETMDSNAVCDVSNYQYETTAGVYSALPAGTTAAISNSGKVVTLTFPAKWTIGANSNVTVANHFTGTKGLILKNAKDGAGNAMATSYAVVASTPTESMATVSSIKITGKNTLEVNFNATGILPVDANPNDFVLYHTTDTAANRLSLTGAEVKAGDRKIVLTVSQDMNPDGSYKVSDATPNATLYLKTVAAGDVAITKSALNTPLTFSFTGLTDAMGGSLVVPADKGALAVSTTNLSEVTLKFDEAIDGITASTASNSAFTVRDSDGKLLIPEADYTVRATDGTNTATIKVTKANYRGPITVELNNNTTVKDNSTAGNLINNFTAVASESEVNNEKAIAGTVNSPADNKFNVAVPAYVSGYTYTLAVGDIDMDPITVGVQSTITINGVTYTVTVAGSVATVAATGNSTANAAATTSVITVTAADGFTFTFVMNIPTATAAAAGGAVTITK